MVSAECVEAQVQALGWSSWGLIGGDGDPARVERRGGLRTQVALLCPLPTYHSPSPPQSHCLIWLGVPEPFLPPDTVLLRLLVSQVTRTVVLIVSLVQNGVCESVPSSPGL